MRFSRECDSKKAEPGLQITVAGGSGFIGTRLCGVLLEQGHDVAVFDTRRPSLPGVSFFAGDVRDAEALRGAVERAETVFHLAALHTDDVRSTSLYYDVNVEGMRALVEACTRSQVEKIVFTSTVACYGLDVGCPDETAPLAPFNDYGRSKVQAEKILLDWAKTQRRQAIIVRPSVVFGEANRGNVYNLLYQIHRRRFPMVGNGENRKSMAYVGNIADFLAWANTHVSGTDIFNYADTPDLKVKELVTTARALMGLRGEPMRIPYDAAVALGRACDIVSACVGKPLPFSKIRVMKFCAETTIDARKAHASGFTPRYTLDYALRQTIQSEFGRGPGIGQTE